MLSTNMAPTCKVLQWVKILSKKASFFFNYKANSVQQPCVKCEADLRTPFRGQPSSTKEMMGGKSKVTSVFTEKVRRQVGVMPS